MKAINKKAIIALTIIISGLFTGILISTVNAQTIISTTQITTAGNRQYPDIYGTKIVFVETSELGNAELCIYDLATATEEQIEKDRSQWSPTIYGNVVVYDDYRNGNLDIYLYDLSTGTETRLTTDSEPQNSPATYGNSIVWLDKRDNINPDIYLYDISTGTESKINEMPVNPFPPAIYGDRVVWISSTEIYMYDMKTGEITKITDSSGSNIYNPDIFGDVIVWQQDFDIYLYDIKTETETQITSDSYAQSNPAIFGNIIAWEDNRNGNYDIYMYDIVSDTEERISFLPEDEFNPAIYGNRIVWNDNGDKNIFLAEISSPSAIIGSNNDIQNILSDQSLIPIEDLADNKRNALLNRLNSVIESVEATMESDDTAVQQAAYEDALSQLYSILEKTDGCAERGSPDVKGSGFTPDWITDCQSQSQIDPLIRDLIANLETLLNA